MTVELWYLVACAILTLFLTIPVLVGRAFVKGGIAWGLGNRDSQEVELPAWARRASRAHTNMVENLGPFAVLMVVAHVAGKSSSLTTLGAGLFFWMRLLHAAAYIAGITGLRTAAFFASIAGELLIFIELLR